MLVCWYVGSSYEPYVIHHNCHLPTTWPTATGQARAGPEARRPGGRFHRLTGGLKDCHESLSVFRRKRRRKRKEWLMWCDGKGVRRVDGWTVAVCRLRSRRSFSLLMFCCLWLSELFVISSSWRSNWCRSLLNPRHMILLTLPYLLVDSNRSSNQGSSIPIPSPALSDLKISRYFPLPTDLPEPANLFFFFTSLWKKLEGIRNLGMDLTLGLVQEPKSF